MDGCIEKRNDKCFIAFDILDLGVKAHPGYTQSSGHFIWDLKMAFTKKARWVKDFHRTPDPAKSNYAGRCLKTHNMKFFRYFIKNIILQIFLGTKINLSCY